MVKNRRNPRERGDFFEQGAQGRKQQHARREQVEDAEEDPLSRDKRRYERDNETEKHEAHAAPYVAAGIIGGDSRKQDERAGK